MRMSRISLVGVVLITLGMLWQSTHEAYATKTFDKVWKKHYLKPDSDKANDVALMKVYEKASCNTCHAGSKKKFNAYGKIVHTLYKKLKKEAKKKMVRRKKSETVLLGLKSAEKVKSDRSDSDSPTYGALIGQGKLPVEDFSKNGIKRGQNYFLAVPRGLAKTERLVNK